MKKHFITLGLALFCSIASFGQSNIECSIQSADLWTDRDYLLAGETLSGVLFIQGSQKPSVTVELSLVRAENERVLTSKYLRLDVQKGDFSWGIPKRIEEGWYWLLASHPGTQEVIAAKKFFVITSGDTFETEDDKKVTVYPEGGNWVSGKKQRFLISASANVTEVVLHENQDPVDTMTLLDGYGSGTILLSDSIVHSFRYQNENEISSISVNPIQKPTLLVEDIASNITITLGGENDKTYQVVIKSKTDSISYELQNQPVILPKRFLPKGLKHIALYDGGKLIGEQWYHIQPNAVMNLDVIGASTSVTSDSVVLDIEVKDQLGRPIPSALVEHAYYPYFQTTDNGIQNEFNLISSHKRRMALSKAENEKEINDLLIGVEFIVDDVLKLSTDCLPEGITVSGNLTETNEKGQSLLLAIPGTLPGLYNTSTFGSSFSFPPILENDQSNAYLTGNPPIKRQAVEITNSMKMGEMNLHSKEVPNQQVIDHLLQMDLIQKNFDQSETATFTSYGKEELKTYYRKADYRISIDDFVYLEEMSVVIKEIIPYVFFKRKRIMIFSEEQRKTFPGRPLLMIDGIPVSSDSSILELEPAEIDHIDVLNSRNALLPLGYLATNGVMAIYTKEGDYVPDEAVRVSLPSYVGKAENQRFSQSSADTRALQLTDVTKWWSGDYLKSQTFTKSYPILELGNEYEVLIGAFHPELGIEFQRKKISISYSDDQ